MVRPDGRITGCLPTIDEVDRLAAWVIDLDAFLEQVSSDLRTPEQRLQLALLDSALREAVAIYQHHWIAPPDDLLPATEWIEQGTIGAFTFEETCAYLHLEPDYVRSFLDPVRTRFRLYSPDVIRYLPVAQRPHRRAG